jgi:hypothetical protein
MIAMQTTRFLKLDEWRQKIKREKKGEKEKKCQNEKEKKSNSVSNRGLEPGGIRSTSATLTTELPVLWCKSS